MKRNIAIILFILQTVSYHSFAGGSEINAPADSFSFRIKLGFTATNAVAVSESVAHEEIEGKKALINIYTLTIPFFETAFIGQLDFRNTPKKINAGNYILPSKLPVPCKGSEFILYDAFVLGSVTGSIENSMELEVHQYTAQPGKHHFRAITTCGSLIYAQEYFRIIVNREKKPVLSLKLQIEQAKQEKKEPLVNEPDMVSFRLSGKTPDNSNLYLKVIPPCGTSCKKTDYRLSDLLSLLPASGDTAFYICDLNGLYMATLLYKREKVGGGTYYKEIMLPEWTNYSYLNEIKSEAAVSKIKAAEKSQEKNIRISPNPVTDILHVKLPDRNIYGISNAGVYNSAGQLLLMQETNNKSFTIDFSGMASGAYIIKINFDGNNYTEKVIKN